MVAVTVVIPAGSADDPTDLPGAARLAAEGIAKTVQWRLDPDAVRLDVRVERGWTAFTLLATPDVWVQSWGVLKDVLFRVPLTSAPIKAARAELLEGFVFEVGAPIREFQVELYRTLVGASDPWSRDPRGTPTALRRADPGAIESFRASYYQMAQATAALVGPVTEADARNALSPVGAGPLRQPPRPGRVAWNDSDRVTLQREMTNSWIGALFPAPVGLPRTHLEFLAHEIREALLPDPPDPGLYSAAVRIEDTPRGPVLVIEAAVMPEAASTWERRILAAVDALEREPDAGFFSWQRRRFRNAILLREGQPEEATLRMAMDLQREGRVRPLRDEIWEIGPRELAEAGDDLDDPRVLVMSPELEGGESGRR